MTSDGKTRPKVPKTQDETIQILSEYELMSAWLTEEVFKTDDWCSK